MKINYCIIKSKQYTCIVLVFMMLFSLNACVTSSYKLHHHIVVDSYDTNRIKESNAAVRAISNNKFEKHTFQYTGKNSLPYRMFIPKDINISKHKIPLVLVLHGSGSIGNDNESQLGLLSKLWLSETNFHNYPAVIIAPQFNERSANYSFDSVHHVLSSHSTETLLSCMALIDSLKKSIPIDEQRIYVIGYSMGGSTVMNALSLRSDLFAAGVSIAGIPPFEKAHSMKQSPLWLIHGNADTENTIESDAAFFTTFKSSNPLLFWEIKDATHSTIMNCVNLETELPRWLFRFKKKKSKVQL